MSAAASRRGSSTPRQCVSHLLGERDRLVAAGDRLKGERQIQFQLGDLVRREVVSNGEATFAVVDRFPVGAPRRSLTTGRRRRSSQCRFVAPPFSVMGEAGRVDARPCRQRRDGMAVELAGTAGGNLVLDRPAGQLVAEHEFAAISDEHTGGETLVDVLGRWLNEPVEQPGLGATRHDGNRIEHLSPRGRKPRRPGKDGEPHACRQRSGWRGERLRDVERIAAGQRVDLVGGRAEGLGEPPHRVDRERFETDPRRTTRGREVAERLAQWVPRADLILAVRDDEQQGQVDGATAKHRDEVDRRIVCPVGVLDDEEHGCA